MSRRRREGAIAMIFGKGGHSLSKHLQPDYLVCKNWLFRVVQFLCTFVLAKAELFPVGKFFEEATA